MTPIPENCGYEVVSIDGTVATVKFLNPWYAGTYMREEEFPDPSDPEKSVKRLVDGDPNPHATKSVNITMLADGSDVDSAAFKDVLEQQARGVFNRMSMVHAQRSDGPDLTRLVGMTGPATIAPGANEDQQK